MKMNRNLSILLKIQPRISIELLVVAISVKKIEIHLNFQDASSFAVRETVEFKKKNKNAKKGLFFFPLKVDFR